MKNTTIKTITTNLNISLAKSQESTAILRACVQLAINEDSKLTFTTICESIPDFAKFSSKTIKNCIRFAKTISKDCKKLSIKELIVFYSKDETRKAYDICVNGNRHKTQEASKQEASKQEASKQEASKQEASKQEASKTQIMLSNHFSENNKNKKNDIELFIDSLSLEELKQAYAFVSNRLGLTINESLSKVLKNIKKVAY